MNSINLMREWYLIYTLDIYKLYTINFNAIEVQELKQIYTYILSIIAYDSEIQVK